MSVPLPLTDRPKGPSTLWASANAWVESAHGVEQTTTPPPLAAWVLILVTAFAEKPLWKSPTNTSTPVRSFDEVDMDVLIAFVR